MYAVELFLISKFGSEYENWASKTPAFIPNIASDKAFASSIGILIK